MAQTVTNNWIGGTGSSVKLGAAGTTSTFGDSTDKIYAGVVSGDGGLTKVGTGTQTFTAAQTYTGPTNINDGQLTLANGGSIAGGADVNNGTLEVANGGTLAGNVTTGC